LSGINAAKAGRGLPKSRCFGYFIVPKIKNFQRKHLTVSLEMRYNLLMAVYCSKWTFHISWLCSGRQHGKYGIKGSRRGHRSQSCTKHDWTGARNVVGVPQAGTDDRLPPMDLCSDFMCSPLFFAPTASAIMIKPSGSKLVWQDPACHAVRFEPKVLSSYLGTRRNGKMRKRGFGKMPTTLAAFGLASAPIREECLMNSNCGENLQKNYLRK